MTTDQILSDDSLAYSRHNCEVAICVLARGYFFKRKYKKLIDRNNSIFEKISCKNTTKFDFLIFHEGNISDSDKEYINKNSPHCEIKYISVKNFFKRRRIAGKNAFCHETSTSKKFGWGYKCMCHFWFDEFLRYTIDYRYVIRIDEDCIIKDFPLDSLIDTMKCELIKYITPRIYGHDNPDVTIGMQELCNEFVNEQRINISPSFDRNPYTNVFLMDGDYFRGNEIFLSFSRKVNKSGCIYVNRWGDLPLWGCVLSLLDKEIFNITNSIKYIHGSHNEVIN